MTTPDFLESYERPSGCTVCGGTRGVPLSCTDPDLGRASCRCAPDDPCSTATEEGLS